MTPHAPSFAKCAAASLVAVFVLCSCDDSRPTLSESLATKAEDQFEYKPNPKKRPTGYAPPTDAELAAWDRSDPEAEKHLYKWDKANLDRMLGYWEDLICFRERVMAEGEKAFGAEPGSPTEEQWHQFKLMYVPHVDAWQKRLFAEEPRIQEKSKFLGQFLAAHEQVMLGYPRAYNESDKISIKKADANWRFAEAKTKKYVGSLGGKWPFDIDPEDTKAVEKHAKVCVEAMTPPDPSGKTRKRRKKKSPI